MRGYCGFVDERGGADGRSLLSKMAKALLRSNGVAELQHVGSGIALGGLIDDTPKPEPLLRNEEGSAFLFYEGELYDCQRLRKQLEASGHTFRTNDSMEIALHLWEEKGRAFLSELHGAFSLALWDNKNKELLLATDRVGHKPLFYHVANDVIFSSQLGSLLAHPAVPFQIDPVALRRYMLFDSVPPPDSIVKGVRKVPPGHAIVIRDGQVRSHHYFTFSFPDGPDRSDKECVSALRETLREAVRRRTADGVPGVFLSGGTDSSAVLASLAEVVDPKQIHTFSIGFAERSFDESRFAREVADHFGTQHHEKILGPSEVCDRLPSILDALDEPIADGSFVPTSLVCELACKTVPTVLGGDGGDELLLGYPTFVAHRMSKYYEPLSKVLNRSLVLPLAAKLPTSTKNVSLDYKIKRFFLGFDYGPIERHFVWIGTFDPTHQLGLLTHGVLNAAPSDGVFDDIGRLSEDCQPRTELDLLSYLYFMLYLQSDGITKVYCATRPAGLTARAPMLDNDFVDMATAFPASVKVRGLTPKYVLRQSLKGRAPSHVVKRPKKGFGAPLAMWLKGPLKDFALSVLSEERIRQDGLFNWHGVKQLWDDHQANRRDNRKQLWSLIAFQSWLDRHRR